MANDKIAISSNDDWVAVFVNRMKPPDKIVPTGVYRYAYLGGFQELCEHTYTLDNMINYTILVYENREPKNEYCHNVMKNICDQQKAFVELIKKD